MNKRSPNEASRAFSVGGWIVLSPAERAERLQQQKRPKPERGTNTSLSYQCPEMNRTRGIPEARFAAFNLPSRFEDFLHYPDGRVEPFPVPSSSQPQAR